MLTYDYYDVSTLIRNSTANNRRMMYVNIVQVDSRVYSAVYEFQKRNRILSVRVC